MKYPSYLVHFNPNHDPRTGRFANAPGGGKSFTQLNRKEKKAYRQYMRDYQNKLQNESSKAPKSKNSDKLYSELEKARKIADDYELRYYDEIDNPGFEKQYNDAIQKWVDAEEKYLVDQGKTTCEYLLTKYTPQDIADMSFGWVPTLFGDGSSTTSIKYDGTVNDLIKQYSKYYYEAHAE